MMDYVQFSVIVNHPLPEVVSHLDQIEEALSWGPTGGMRFTAMQGRTFVTVFGAASPTAPDVLTSLIESFVRASGSQLAAA